MNEEQKDNLNKQSAIEEGRNIKFKKKAFICACILAKKTR
jgi:hypothetical protein